MLLNALIEPQRWIYDGSLVYGSNIADFRPVQPFFLDCKEISQTIVLILNDIFAVVRQKVVLDLFLKLTSVALKLQSP